VGDKTLEIDSRPSDAIALALRTESPIFVHQRVVDKSRNIDHKQQALFSEENKEKWSELLEQLDPEDFSKYKM
jgi:bifunctional DNase/RNase